MRIWMLDTIAAGGLVLVGAAVFAQTNSGHDRVPPYREPSPYMSASEIQTALNALDPKLVASRTGGSIPLAPARHQVSCADA